MTTNAAQPQLIAMLRRCRDQFSFYATNHRAKLGNPELAPALRDDTLAKAEANEAMVMEIDGVLSIDGIVDVGSSDTLAAEPLQTVLSRPELLGLLRRGHDEILGLRREVGSLAPRAHAYDTIAQLLKLTRHDEAKGYSVDVLWELQGAVEKIVAERDAQRVAKGPDAS